IRRIWNPWRSPRCSTCRSTPSRATSSARWRACAIAWVARPARRIGATGRARDGAAVPVNPDLEQQLREALRRVDPAEGFAERVQARIERERLRPQRPRPALYRWAPQALAAALLMAALGLYGWHAQRERQGLEALRVTGQKLDLAYRGVKDAARPATAGDAGA